MGDLIEIESKSKHLGGIALIVLTLFEITENIQLESPKDNYNIRVIVDGEEVANQLL